MKNKMIVFMLLLLILCSCSSSAAGTAEHSDDYSGDFLVIPEAEDDEKLPTHNDSAGISEGSEGVSDDLWIPDTETEGTDTQDVYDSDFDVSKLRFEDFDNFYGQITYNGLPEGLVRQPLGKANGVWKYNLKFRQDTSDGKLFDELGYAEMYVHDNDDPPVKIILHPRLASDGYEIWEESDEEIGYEPFAGYYDENNDLKLTGNDCILHLKQYYAYEGREYLIATLWMSEEDFADFLMIRGQE